MKASLFIFSILVLATCDQGFLGEIFIEEQSIELLQMTATQQPLFSEAQLNEVTETAHSTANLEEENISSLQATDEQQELIAQKYSNLAAEGDCAIVYAKCHYKGASQKICNQEAMMLFELPIYSLYVPQGEQIALTDQVEGVTIAFLENEECLLQPIMMADSDKDLAITEGHQMTLVQDDLNMEASAQDAAQEPVLQNDTDNQVQDDSHKSEGTGYITEVKSDASIEDHQSETSGDAVHLEGGYTQDVGQVSRAQPEQMQSQQPQPLQVQPADLDSTKTIPQDIPQAAVIPQQQKFDGSPVVPVGQGSGYGSDIGGEPVQAFSDALTGQVQQ